MKHFIVLCALATIVCTVCQNPLALFQSETSKKSYDFVVDIPSVSSITRGWTINISPESKKMFETRNKEMHQINVVGLLGYYSKGKSFIVNRLYNAGRISAPGWLGETKLGRQLEVDEAPGVTTKGISGVFTSYAKDISESRLVIFDTAGRNAPTQNMGTVIAAQRNEISELRSKERLIDDMIIDTSDIILYVVDELLNEDQRTILHILENLAENQRFFVVHNFKRLNCHEDAKVEKHIKQQIIDTFAASKMTNINVPFGKLAPVVYQSSWPIERYKKVVPLWHLVLYNDEVCNPENEAAFDWLARLSSTHNNQRKRKENLLQDLQTSISHHIRKYIKAVDVGSGKDSSIIDLSSLQLKQMQDMIYLPLDNSKRIEILQWDLRDMPFPFSTGQYTPPNSNYVAIDHKNDIRTYFIRIDLPGFTEYDEIKKGSIIPEGFEQSWFQVLRERDEQSYIYRVHGYRANLLNDIAQDCYGRFDLAYRVEFRYNGKPAREMDKSVLVITVPETSDNEF